MDLGNVYNVNNNNNNYNKYLAQDKNNNKEQIKIEWLLCAVFTFLVL